MPTRIDELLHEPIVVINLGLKKFAESLEEQQVEVVQVDWVPPAGGDKEMVELLDAILEARQAARQRGGSLTVVASLCGTEDDPQDLSKQARMLEGAGVVVFRSNARAAYFCGELLKRT